MAQCLGVSLGSKTNKPTFSDIAGSQLNTSNFGISCDSEPTTPTKLNTQTVEQAPRTLLATFNIKSILGVSLGGGILYVRCRKPRLQSRSKFQQRLPLMGLHRHDQIQLILTFRKYGRHGVAVEWNNRRCPR